MMNHSMGTASEYSCWTEWMYLYAALGKELRWFGNSAAFASLMELKQCIFLATAIWVLIDVAHVATLLDYMYRGTEIHMCRFMDG